MGLGVVVITHCGFSPKRNPNINWSKVSGYCHAANSSHHALWNCEPLNLFGSVAEKPTIFEPLNRIISDLLTEYPTSDVPSAKHSSGIILIKPLTPPKQTLLKSPNVGATTAIKLLGCSNAYLITSSAPVLVLPQPRPASISHILKSSCGVNCFPRP